MEQTTIILIICAVILAGRMLGQSDKIRQALKRLFSAGNKDGIFDHSFIEVKSFYLRQFGLAPCISYICNIDVTKVFSYIQQGFAGKILTTYQRNYYNWQREKQEFTRTLFLLENKVIIELGSDYAEIVFSADNYTYANELVRLFSTYKATVEEEAHEINIITQTNDGLELKQLDIKQTDLDIGLYYNEDFLAIDEIIMHRLGKNEDKGIILLHGLPGTGKTTYLRHLIGKMKKKVLFVSPSVAANLMSPALLDLLIDNPNAVLVIEDAENIIMDRRYSSESSVSNLLNLSDGLLSDCLNVQIICIFNNALSMVDSALMRKGRLIARYEFGKLTVQKAQQLSDHLGFSQIVNTPMTLAEITNAGDREFEMAKVEVVGFRRAELEMN